MLIAVLLAVLLRPRPQDEVAAAPVAQKATTEPALPTKEPRAEAIAPAADEVAEAQDDEPAATVIVVVTVRDAISGHTVDACTITTSDRHSNEHPEFACDSRGIATV